LKTAVRPTASVPTNNVVSRLGRIGMVWSKVGGFVMRYFEPNIIRSDFIALDPSDGTKTLVAWRSQPPPPQVFGAPFVREMAEIPTRFHESAVAHPNPKIARATSLFPEI
jgi:hypothetical protein